MLSSEKNTCPGGRPQRYLMFHGRLGRAIELLTWFCIVSQPEGQVALGLNNNARLRIDTLLRKPRDEALPSFNGLSKRDPRDIGPRKEKKEHRV